VKHTTHGPWQSLLVWHMAANPGITQGPPVDDDVLVAADVAAVVDVDVAALVDVGAPPLPVPLGLPPVPPDVDVEVAPAGAADPPAPVAAVVAGAPLADGPVPLPLAPPKPPRPLRSRVEPWAQLAAATPASDRDASKVATRMVAPIFSEFVEAAYCPSERRAAAKG
jgi:hypothetical protein